MSNDEEISTTIKQLQTQNITWITLFLMERDLRQGWVKIGIGWTWTSISCLLMKRSSRFSSFELMNLAEWTSASMTQLVISLISSAGSRTETLLSWITLGKGIGWSWTLFACLLMKRSPHWFSSFELRTCHESHFFLINEITLIFNQKRSWDKEESGKEFDEPQPQFHVHLMKSFSQRWTI